MSSKCQELLLLSITNYYNKFPDKKLLLHKIIQSDYKISLRVIDWFITHYTRDKNVVIWIDNDHIIDAPNSFHNLKNFNIYLEYRTQLKSYTKMLFDPFRRHDRISFTISKDPLKEIETTIGQLNFFRWIFQNNLLQYIETHQDAIEEEMTKYQSIKKYTNSPATTPSAKIESIKEHSRKNIQNTRINTSCFIRFE
jgi:hypothetical protein